MTSACPHCAAGNPAVWQPHSSEWVHRRSWLSGTGRMFGSTLCVEKSTPVARLPQRRVERIGR